MSEETQEPAIPKQYMLIVDEISMAMLSQMMPKLIFVQVMGRYLDGDDNNQFLVSPSPKPKAELPSPEVVEE